MPQSQATSAELPPAISKHKRQNISTDSVSLWASLRTEVWISCSAASALHRQNGQKQAARLIVKIIPLKNVSEKVQPDRLLWLKCAFKSVPVYRCSGLFSQTSSASTQECSQPEYGMVCDPRDGSKAPFCFSTIWYSVCWGGNLPLWTRGTGTGAFGISDRVKLHVDILRFLKETHSKFLPWVTIKWSEITSHISNNTASCYYHNKRRDNFLSILHLSGIKKKHEIFWNVIHVNETKLTANVKQITHSIQTSLPDQIFCEAPVPSTSLTQYIWGILFSFCL